MFFIGAATLAVMVYVILDLSHNSHANVSHLLMQYALVFPALILFWRRSQGASRSLRSIPDLRVPVILVFAVLTTFISFSYDQGYTIPDESSYVFQARVFASGHLKAEPMPGATMSVQTTPTEIHFEHQIHTVRGWFSKYPPGWPLALAIGYYLRCSWLINPILGIVLLLMVNYLASLWGRPTQIIAVLVAAASAYTVHYSTGFMSHSLAAVVGLTALTASFYAIRTERLSAVALCFAMVVLGTEIRPYTGAVIALLCAVCTLYGFRGTPRLFNWALAIMSVAGVISVALFLLINHIYTGEFLLSPYAYQRGVAKVQELTLDPFVIAYNLWHTWRWALTATVLNTFPFVFVAAGYACWKEREYRRELLFLALLFPMLVTAHAFQTEGSSSFGGERYYYEGYAALCVVAARGFWLVMSDWRIRNTAGILALMVFGAIQAVFIVSLIRNAESRVFPRKLAYRASVAKPTPKLVFLRADGSFMPKDWNWNDANWKSSPTVFLIDPGIARRDAVACLFGDSAYRVVSYEEKREQALANDFVTVCRLPETRMQRSAVIASSVE